MPNPLGGVDIVLGGEAHELKFRASDLARLDHALSQAGLPGIIKLLADGNINIYALQLAVWHGLAHEQNRKLTLARVAELLDENPGQMLDLWGKVAEALEPWLPLAQQKGAENPTSTGENS